MTKSRQYLQLMILGLAFSSCFALPYVHFKLYDLVTQSLEVTNQQLGTFMTVFTICAMISYLPAGIITDKCKPYYLISASLGAQAATQYILLVRMDYVGGLIAWSVSGVIMAFFWIPLVKAVRESGTANDQGKMFGYFYGATGVFSTLVGLLGAKLVSMASEDVKPAFINLMHGHALFCVIAGLAVFFVIRKNPDSHDGSEKYKTITLTSLKGVFCLPAVWLMTALVFCSYGVYLCIAYLTPYTTNVLGVTIAMGGVIGTIRAYGLRLFTGPIGGWLADAIGSTAKLIFAAFIIVAVITFVLIFLPEEASSLFVVFITLLFGAVGLVIYNTMFACIEETAIPPEKTGVVVAVVSLIGYTPEAIFPPLFGYLLDTFGNTGYTYIFECTVILCICGSLVCWLILDNKNRATTAANS